MTDVSLLEIARCPEIEKCLSEHSTHPCTKIVRSQDIRGPAEFQVPEPWSGRIETAPILFISSNPSISTEEIFPIMDWKDADIVDFFQNRFGGGKQPWILDGTKSLRKDWSHGQWTRFWAGVKGRTKELLEWNPAPGVDYSLTELVHCKSRQELGVSEALDHCISLYLDKVLKISGARVLVGLGSVARDVLSDKYHLDTRKILFGPLEIAGKDRMISFLPHPNAWVEKKFGKVLTTSELSSLKEFLNKQKDHNHV